MAINLNDFIKEPSAAEKAEKERKAAEAAYYKHLQELAARNDDSGNELLEKVKKLLRLGCSGNIHESAAACAKAQELMDKYNITHDDIINNKKEPLEKHIVDGEGQRRRTDWKARLAAVVARHNMCHCFTSGPLINIFGKRSNVQTASYLYRYLVVEIDRLTKENTIGEGKTWTTNFRMGCIDTIMETLKKQREETFSEAYRVAKEQENASVSLVLLDKRIAAYKEQLNEAVRIAKDVFHLRNLRYNFNHRADAREVGRESAKEIHFSGRGLSGGMKQLPQ